MRNYLAAKLHRIVVTAASVDYVGSVSIDSTLMADVGIDPYEQVHVVNLSNGERWITYAVPGERGEFALNGGGARLGVVGDRCVVMTYQQSDSRPDGCTVALIGADNRSVQMHAYDFAAR